jgi:hypothetical protein
MDPVFAMDESFFLDGGSRLDDVEESALAQVSAWRSVANPNANVPDVGRCPRTRFMGCQNMVRGFRYDRLWHSAIYRTSTDQDEGGACCW